MGPNRFQYGSPAIFLNIIWIIEKVYKVHSTLRKCWLTMLESTDWISSSQIKSCINEWGGLIYNFLLRDILLTIFQIYIPWGGGKGYIYIFFKKVNSSMT